MNYKQDYWWLTKNSVTFLERGYIEKGKDPKERFREIAENSEKILKIKGFADKFESYIKKGFYSLASPIVANFGTKKGLPISCNAVLVQDTIESILEKTAEIGVMSKYGAGTAGFFGLVRPRGSKISTGGETSGPVHFMELFDTTTNVISQSNVRRGQFASFLPITHPDILEFLAIRSEGHPIQHMSIGVTVSDKFMQDVEKEDPKASKIWRKVLKKRYETGYPYIFFEGNANKNAPQVYKDKGHVIHATQLCTEIMLSTSSTESFVCNLSSMNALLYDEWKETDAIETLTYFLDSVTTEYIDKTNTIKYMECAHNFAKNQRAIGIGVLGWHSFLQSKMIPFESLEANSYNVEIFKLINERTLKASKELAEKYGEPELLKGYGVRQVCRCAVAPTKSSSFIFGAVSQSIEPLDSNLFTNDLAKGKFTYKNHFLEEVLKTHNKNTKEIWDNILAKGGSVQHLKFLSDKEKDVFKTFAEISQHSIVVQAACRQKYIDQGQSLNLMIHHDTPLKEVNKLIMDGWKMGLKSFYYQKGVNPAMELNRSQLSCSSCEA